MQSNKLTNMRGYCFLKPRKEPRRTTIAPITVSNAILHSAEQAVPNRLLPLEGLALDITTVGLGHGGGLNLGSTAVATAEVATAIQPGSLQAAFGLEGANLRLHLQSQTDIVQAVDKAVLAEAINIKGGKLVAFGILDLLVDKVDFDLTTGAGLVRNLRQSSLVRNDDGKHAVLEGIVEEDVSE